MTSLEPLARRLGLSTESESLTVALTHSSYAAEHGCESNERLEFLGDAVVDLAVADLIVSLYPDLNEGTGSLVRSRVVNEASLARAARDLDLAPYVRLGRGEIKSRGSERPSLLADAFEAVVAAVFLDLGYPAARDFVLDALGEAVASASLDPGEVDPKTRLRQWADAQGLGEPLYEVESEGPAHATTFEASVVIDGRVRGVGHGRSKKAAEAEAARAAFEASQRA
ncbi:MAG TPA: ribonuclease III [Acidimicrobiales bacterium]|nr:ribonuclease III [Acidimicrobiales bacterium]